jgi:hypothetical protein
VEWIHSGACLSSCRRQPRRASRAIGRRVRTKMNEYSGRGDSGVTLNFPCSAGVIVGILFARESADAAGC